MMYKWLPTDSSSNLPPPSHTNLGVGGMVFNDKNQILVVTEQHFEYPHWKLPGGYVERGTSTYCTNIMSLECKPANQPVEILYRGNIKLRFYSYRSLIVY